jgi:2,5-dihydroxypyridine 5,6-dioxygenase
VSAARLAPQAATLLDGVLEVDPGYEVLIVCDGTVSRELVAALRLAATSSGRRPYVLEYPPVAPRAADQFGLFTGVARTELVVPAGLIAALRGFDSIVLATSDVDVLLLSTEFRDLVRQGAKVCSLTYMTTDDALRLLPSSLAEVHELRERTDRGLALMSQARSARVTSEAGTDVTIRLGQYAARAQNGVIQRGTRQTLPGGQVIRIPDDRTANGLVVIDRSVAAGAFVALSEPVRFVVRDGYVTDIAGGRYADDLRRWLEARQDPAMFHLTELAFGTNPRCRLTAVSSPREDTHTLGCVSFALGADAHIGGATNAPAHVDMTMRRATLELDGRVVVRSGQLEYA